MSKYAFTEDTGKNSPQRSRLGNPPALLLGFFCKGVEEAAGVRTAGQASSGTRSAYLPLGN